MITYEADTFIDNVLQGLTSAAVDYVMKPFAKESLLARLKIHIEAAKKSCDFDPEKLKRLAALLTDTEMSVARFAAQEYTNTEIAERLCYSYHYIKRLQQGFLKSRRLIKGMNCVKC